MAICMVPAISKLPAAAEGFCGRVEPLIRLLAAVARRRCCVRGNVCRAKLCVLPDEEPCGVAADGVSALRMCRLPTEFCADPAKGASTAMVPCGLLSCVASRLQCHGLMACHGPPGAGLHAADWFTTCHLLCAQFMPFVGDPQIRV